jgi:hypothetical protein
VRLGSSNDAALRWKGSIRSTLPCAPTGAPRRSDVRSPWRSCAKPFQLWVALDALGDPAFVDEAFLAIGASSHSGTDEQVALVRKLLAALDVAERDLGCGRAAPAHEASLYELLARGESPAPSTTTVRGSTRFQIAAARKVGPGDYRASDHPLQQRVLARVAELAASDRWWPPTAARSDVRSVADGMARAYHALGRADDLRTASDPGCDDRPTRSGERTGPDRSRSQCRRTRAVRREDRCTRGLRRGASSPRLGIAIKCTSADEDALAAALPPLLRPASHPARSRGRIRGPGRWCAPRRASPSGAHTRVSYGFGIRIVLIMNEALIA